MSKGFEEVCIDLEIANEKIEALKAENDKFRRIAKEYYKFNEIKGYEAKQQDILDFRCEMMK